MTKLERKLASECVKHLGEADEEEYFYRYFNYAALMLECNKENHDIRLYDVMVDFYKYIQKIPRSSS